MARTRRPLVWMDDDAITEPTVAALDDLADRLALPMLAVATHLATGVRPDQMARVDDFLAAVVEGTARPGLVRRPRLTSHDTMPLLLAQGGRTCPPTPS